MGVAAKFDVREAVLEAARTSVQMHGFTALSFRDLAAEVGVKSASVHYHFPTKADLAEALVGRNCEDQNALIEDLLSSTHNHDQLIAGYVGIYRAGFDGRNRMCLCGVISAEISGLPEPVRTQIDLFREVNVNGVAKILRRRHRRTRTETLRKRAFAIYAALEGAQLIAHGLGGNLEAFDEIVDAYSAAGLFA
jgi:TetR/AcrR family transcriptional repressor of nem operon